MSWLSTGFFGSGHFAARCLSRLSAKARPCWVVTNAPRQAGRGMNPRPTPVQEACERIGIPFFTTEHLSRDEARIEWVRENCPDLLLVVDFGHLIKEPLLSLAPMQCLNLHPSLLPKYRGAAPVQRALQNGEAVTGVTLFRLTAGMDCGPILDQAKIPIEESDDSASLFAKSADAGTDLLLHYLLNVPSEAWHFTPQDDAQTTLATKIDKAEAEISWTNPALAIFNKIRAFNPSPVAFTTTKGKRLRLLSSRRVNVSGQPGQVIDAQDGLPVIGCGQDAVVLLEVQPEGKKVQSAADWFRGSRLSVGDFLA